MGLQAVVLDARFDEERCDRWVGGGYVLPSNDWWREWLRLMPDCLLYDKA